MSDTTPFSRISIAPDKPVYRQIAEQIRSFIIEGEIEIGSRLPPVRELADKIGTSVFSIQEALAPLVREGLIDRTPSRGTFVLGNKIRLTSIGLYFGDSLASGSEFYQFLYSRIYQQLEERGIEVHLIMDSRRRIEQGIPFPKLLGAIQSNEIQAVIGIMLYSSHVDWLSQLGVPVALMTSQSHPQAVHYDFDELIEKGLKQLKVRGARSVANLPGTFGSSSLSKTHFNDIARSLGLEVIESLAEANQKDPPPPLLKAGYEAFHRLWQQPRKPDGIFVFPDTTVAGVCMAIKELQIRVPEDLKVVIHRNRGVNLLCPMPVDSVVFNVEDLARELILKLDRQNAGAPIANVRIPTLVEPGY